MIISLLLWPANNTGGTIPNFFFPPSASSAHLLLTLISFSQGQKNETNLGANSSRGAGRDGVGCVKGTNRSKSTLQQRLKLIPEDAILNLMDSELCISSG